MFANIFIICFPDTEPLSTTEDKVGAHSRVHTMGTWHLSLLEGGSNRNSAWLTVDISGTLVNNVSRTFPLVLAKLEIWSNSQLVRPPMVSRAIVDFIDWESPMMGRKSWPESFSIQCTELPKLKSPKTKIVSEFDLLCVNFLIASTWQR